MPLFKRRARIDEQRPNTWSAARVISEEQMLDHLRKEMVDARRDGLPRAVLSVIAQSLPRERLRPGEMDFASNALVSRLRASDVVCVLGEGALIAILSTDAVGARVVAHRVAADLAVRHHGGVRRKWLTGTVLFPDAGDDAETLVQSAIHQAQ